MKIRLSIDRFEGDRKKIAVLLAEDGTQINVPKTILPKGSKAADILTLSIEKDADATKQVARETKVVQEELAQGDPGGDLKL